MVFKGGEGWLRTFLPSNPVILLVCPKLRLGILPHLFSAAHNSMGETTDVSVNITHGLGLITGAHAAGT